MNVLQNNDLERAADWIFSHLDELDTIVDAPDPPSLSAGEGDVPMETGTAQGVSDGPGNYELFAFISHMGTSTLCGHYVCHVKKDGRCVRALLCMKFELSLAFLFC